MSLDKILIVDDEPGVRTLLADLLGERGHKPLAVPSLAQARDILDRETFDLVISDLQLPDGDGIAFLQALKKKDPSLPMMIITGFGTMDSAVKALRLGVMDYLLKPLDPSLLNVSLERLESLIKVKAENEYLRNESSSHAKHLFIWGESQPMKDVKSMVEKIGQSDATVLIEGQSGTGKEIIARALHENSSRINQPFIRVNCAAIPATLLESELFGHEKGAFTGASQRRQGRFELADKGTILLDEISEIPPELQVKLLRVLQEREFERLGGNLTIQIDVRIIATTNRNLQQEVENGHFREDLFFRLNVIPIHIPPLRRRGDDVCLLANFFLDNFSKKHRKKISGFTAEACRRMLEYPWPGNVRELQNTIERSVLLSEEKDLLDATDILIPSGLADSRQIPGGAGWPDGIPTFDQMEIELVRKALSAFKGNRTRAAEALGISIRTMRNKLAEYRSRHIPVE